MSENMRGTLPLTADSFWRLPSHCSPLDWVSTPEMNALDEIRIPCSEEKMGPHEPFVQVRQAPRKPLAQRNLIKRRRHFLGHEEVAHLINRAWRVIVALMETNI